MDAQEGQPAQERRRVEVGDVGLERCALRVRRRRDGLQDRAEQRLEVGGVGHAAVGRLHQRRAPGPRRGVDDREVERVLAVVLVEEVEEQLVGLVDDLGDPRVRPVDLVDHEDHRQVGVQRLAQHEPRLRQRAFGGVDEQHDAVDHRQAALDLAAEVGVAGGVDDVDGQVAVLHGRVLREDRDALLALEVAGVHDPVGDTRLLLVRGERALLVEHRVHQRGLAVVDVGDDGDVAKVAAQGGGQGRVTHGEAGTFAGTEVSRRPNPQSLGAGMVHRRIVLYPPVAPGYPRSALARGWWARCVCTHASDLGGSRWGATAWLRSRAPTSRPSGRPGRPSDAPRFRHQRPSCSS